jgi:hypothetical protein
LKTREFCRINISRQGWTNRNPCKLEGKVYDEQGTAQYEINGNWNSQLNIKHLGTGIEEVAWKIHQKPPMFER